MTNKTQQTIIKATDRLRSVVRRVENEGKGRNWYATVKAVENHVGIAHKAIVADPEGAASAADRFYVWRDRAIKVGALSTAIDSEIRSEARRSNGVRESLPHTGKGPYGHGRGCPVQTVQRGEYRGVTVIVTGANHTLPGFINVRRESNGERLRIPGSFMVQDDGSTAPILRYVDPNTTEAN